MPVTPLTAAEFYTLQSHEPLIRRTQGGWITVREPYADVCHECFFDDCVASEARYCPISRLARERGLGPQEAVTAARRVRRLGLGEKEAWGRFEEMVENE